MLLVLHRGSGILFAIVDLSLLVDSTLQKQLPERQNYSALGRPIRRECPLVSDRPCPAIQKGAGCRNKPRRQPFLSCHHPFHLLPITAFQTLETGKGL